MGKRIADEDLKDIYGGGVMDRLQSRMDQENDDALDMDVPESLSDEEIKKRSHLAAKRSLGV